MSETIDDLLVKLGMETDADSFREGERMFSGIRSKALAFGAVVGGLAFGVKKLTDNFARETDAQGKFAQVYGASAQYVDALGYALERQGGSADEAFSSIKRIRDLMESTEWGEIPSEAFRVIGFDPMLLQGVTDVATAYERIADASARLDPEARRRALSSLGFGDSEIRLFSGGSGGLNDLLAEAQKLAPVTQEMVSNAETYNDAQTRLAKAIEGITDLLGNKLAPALSDTADVMSSFLASIREPLGDGIDNLMSNTEKEFEYLFGWADKIKREIEMIKNGEGAAVASDTLGRFLSYVGLDDFVERSRQRDADKDSSVWTLPNSSGGAANPVVYQGGTHSNNYEFNIDARGSTDPQGTANAVEEAVNRALERAGQAAVNSAEGGSR